MSTDLKHKRDVILEFYSSPDAILNALHQAGWQVITKELYDGLVRDAMSWRKQLIAEVQCSEKQDMERTYGLGMSDQIPPARSEQQEWTVRELPIGFYGLYEGEKLLSDDFHEEAAANVVRDAHNAALAAECQRSEIAKHAWDTADRHRNDLQRMLLSALAAIEKAIGLCWDCKTSLQIGEFLKAIDLSLLHKYDDEVRKPLVDALEYSRQEVTQLSPSDFKLRWLDVIDDALAKVKEGKC